MSGLPTPEERAEALVEAKNEEPGGPWFVELRELADPPVRLGPYANPQLAREDAQHLRKFLAAAIEEARQGAG
jgi:hypothetical protein